MMSYDWNSHGNEQDQILLDPLLLDFPNAEIDAQYSLNLQGTQNLVNSRQDQDSVLNTDLSSWPWPEETVSPKGPSAQGFSRQDVDQSQEQCHDQNTEQTIEHAVKEIHQRMKNLEDRMEKRITEIEGQVNDSQNGLEQQAARVQSEIEMYIRKLRAWASEVKMIVASATEPQTT
ncbi:hypothetical protein S40285_10925, partial [Stachybotrys chlorohalonatus IBT 40285]